MGPLLAEEASFAFPELVVPLWVGTVAAGGGVRDPAAGRRSGAGHDGAGEESPAVVDLLTNHWRVTPDVIPATLLDLAARGFVDMDQHGEGRTVCRVRRSDGAGLA
jgi:hypothetical protein